MKEVTLSRMDKLGLKFMSNKESVSVVESFELLADLLGVDESQLYDQMSGKVFVPKPELEIE